MAIESTENDEVKNKSNTAPVLVLELVVSKHSDKPFQLLSNLTIVFLIMIPGSWILGMPNSFSTSFPDQTTGRYYSLHHQNQVKVCHQNQLQVVF